MTIETRAVLAGAYTRRRGDQSMLTHAVALIDGELVGVLCNRVQADNLADRFAHDVHATPTCPICARRAKDAQR